VRHEARSVCVYRFRRVRISGGRLRPAASSGANAAGSRAGRRSPFNWGGLHAGLNLGGGFGDAEGFEIGGQVGYNWQINQIVFGAETDLQWASMSKTSTVTGANLPAKQELDWFGTFRGRIGYAFDPFWSARIEYLHISLDGFTPSAAAAGRITVGRLDNDIIRGGFNYKLMP
jgi:outer membrane immunogenic protein